MNSDQMQSLAGLGATSEHLVILAEWIETGPKDISAEPIRRVMETDADSALVGKILHWMIEQVTDAARVRRQRNNWDSKSGPMERWGYDGPITPRLPDRDWWPLRNSVVREADSTCHYCGDRHDNMCADHVVPLSRGGSNDRDNLVCCCIPCNSSKADRLLSEWRGRYR